jgi:hypothetical protein
LPVDGDALVANVGRVAKSFACLRVRSVGLDAESPELLLAHREVKRELVVDVALDGSFADGEA